MYFLLKIALNIKNNLKQKEATVAKGHDFLVVSVFLGGSGYGGKTKSWPPTGRVVKHVRSNRRASKITAQNAVQLIYCCGYKKTRFRKDSLLKDKFVLITTVTFGIRSENRCRLGLGIC